MMNIATLTLNPTLDVSFEVGRIYPTHKIRGDSERHDPGGGGINVARVFVRLGGNARCVYLCGGAAGAALHSLLDLHQLVRNRVAISGETRVSTSVYERETGQEYRFVTEGPVISETEWQECEAIISQLQCDYLVISGSLPRGAPDELYARIARATRIRGIRVVLDSSGVGLAKGLAGGTVFLVKPSIGELAALCGTPLETDEAVIAAAKAIVERGEAEHVVVSLGSEGAILVNASETIQLPAIPVEVSSAVGAGDSFLAAMVFKLAEGRPAAEALRFGMAGGAAAVLTPGTGLARAEDIYRLHSEMP